MAKAILTLVFALQAMLPPGHCWCQHIAAPEVATEKAVPVSKGGCCHHDCTDDSDSSQEDGEQPSKTKHDHLPGCPALNSIPDNYLPTIVAPTDAAPATTLAPLAPEMPAAVQGRSLHQPSAASRDSTPLFVRHCALLI